MVKAGRLRALARDQPRALAADARDPRHGRGRAARLRIAFWYGLFVPAGTPPDIMRKLFAAATSAMRDPASRPRSRAKAPMSSCRRRPKHFAAFLAEDNQFWVQLAKDAGVTNN